MGLAALTTCLLTLTFQNQVYVTGQEARAKLLKMLATQLGSDDPRTRWRAVRQSVRLGKGAVPTLAALLETIDRDGRPRPEAEMAGEALVLLGPFATNCLPTVVKLIEDGIPAQMSLGLRVMQFVGPYDADEIEANKQLLYQLMRESHRFRKTTVPREQIIGCLMRLKDPSTTVAELIVRLKSANVEHIEMGLERLVHLRGTAMQATGAIRDVLVDEGVRRFKFRFRGATRDSIRLKAAELLVNLRAAKDVRLQAHTELLNHRDPAIRQRSALTLGSLGAEADWAAVTAMISATSDCDKLVAWDAITALGMLGKAAHRALPALRKLAKGNDKARAARARAAIKGIEKIRKRRATESCTRGGFHEHP